MITYEGIQTQSIAVDKRGIRTATIVYELIATAGEGPYAVGNHTSLPRIGQPHPEDIFNWCVGLSVDLSNPKTGYTATATYSSEREITENPLAEPVNIEWDTEQFQEPLVIDEDGYAVVNSAGDPYDPPVMRDNSRWFAEVTCNVASVPTWVLTYPDAVNSDAFTVDGIPVAVGLAKVQKLRISGKKTRNDVPYRVVTFHLHFREEGWHFKPLDAGFRRIYSGTNRELITMENEAGETEYPVAPVPLDGSGVELTDPTLTTCVYGDHRGYKNKAFASLPGINT